MVAINLGAGRPQIPQPSVVDPFGNIKTLAQDSLTSIQEFTSKSTLNIKKFTDSSVKNLKSLSGGFGGLGKSAGDATKNIKAVESTVSVLGQTLRGTGKELFLVGTSIGVLAGAFFDLQQKSALVAIPLKAVADVLEVISNKSKGVDLANSLGIDTSSIQQLELFKAGVFGNVQALDAFRRASQVSGIEFQLNLTKLNTILKQSRQELTKSGEEARRLSKELGGTVGSAEIIAGQYQIASAGFTQGADSLAVAGAAAKLATVGFNDFFSTADLVTKSLRAYGLEASKAGEIAAKLNAIVEVGITTVPELAAGFAETAVVANAFGISIDQAGAAVATITTQGSSTAEALTGIEALFRTLANQTPQAIKALGELSLNGGKVKFDLATVQAKGLGGALNDLFTAANGNVSVLREIIPESRALQAALALAAQGGGLFATSLEAISSATPEKLDTLFGEVKEDPTIKLRAIATSANELATTVGESFSSFTDSATQGLAGFVAGAEVLSNIPGLKGFLGIVLGLSDGVGKITGVIGTLGGAALGVVGTLASINIFNNLFNGGLITQAKLIGNSIFKLRDFGSALKQITGIDTTKDVTKGLADKLPDLQAREQGLRFAGNVEGADLIKVEIDSITASIDNLQQAALKPLELNSKSISDARDEVEKLEAEIKALPSTAPAQGRESLLNRQADKIGEVGRLKLEQERLIQEGIASGNISDSQAGSFRLGSNQAVDDVLPFSKSLSIKSGEREKVTPIGVIQAGLTQAKAEAALVPSTDKAAQAAAQTRITNYTESLRLTASGTQGLIDKTGKLTKSFSNSGVAGRFLASAGTAIAQGFTVATQPLFKSTDAAQSLTRAVKLAGATEAITDIQGAAVKLAGSLGTVAKTAGTLGKNALAGLGGLGASLLTELLNPLTIAIAAIGAGFAIYSRFQEAESIQNRAIEKNAEAEKKRTEAIDNTNRSLEEQKKIQGLVSLGLSQDDAKKSIQSQKQAEQITGAAATSTGDRGVRLQRQIGAQDFRSADDFLTDRLSSIRDGKLGLKGSDTSESNAGQVAITTGLASTGAVAGAVALGGSLASGFAIAGTAIFPGVGTILGFAAGAVIGATVGLVFSQALATAQAEQQKSDLKAEFLNRSRTELESKFKVDQARTPEERTKRQAKVNEKLNIRDKEFDAAAATSGLNDSVVDNLRKSVDPVQLATVKNIDALQLVLASFKRESDSALAGLSNNQLEAGILSDDLTEKTNDLLGGKTQVQADDLARINAELKGRTDELKVRQQDLEEQSNVSGLDASLKSKFKQDLQKISVQIDDENKLKEKLTSKIQLRNTDVLNRDSNSQGLGATITLKEETSAVSSVNAIKTALQSDKASDRNNLPSNIDALKASLENLGDLDTAATQRVQKQVKDLLELKDKDGSNLIQSQDAKIILDLINTVSGSVSKLAAERIGLLETAARRLQGLASNSSVAGSTVAREAIDDNEGKVLDEKIKAQQAIVDSSQTGKQRELAQNDLIQLQLDKQNKTIEARVNKELAASDLLFEREKARLGLAQSTAEGKASLLGDFGLDNREAAGQALAAKRQSLEADVAKQRSDLATQQQASVEQSQALSKAKPIVLDKPVETKKEVLDSKPFDAEIAAINKRQGDLNTAARQRAAVESDLESFKSGSTFEVDGKNFDTKTGKTASNALNQTNTDELNSQLAKIEKAANAARVKVEVSKINAGDDLREKQNRAENLRTNKPPSAGSTDSDGKVIIQVRGDDAQTDEVKRRNAIQKATLEDKITEQQKALALEEQRAIYQNILANITPISQAIQETLSSTVALLAPLKQIDSAYVSQVNSLGLIGLSSQLQLVAASETLALERKKIDLQEDALRKSGNLDAAAKEQLDRKRNQLDNQFKGQEVSLAFQAKQESIDAIAKKIQSTIETKLKGLNLTQDALGTFIGSFEGEDADSKEAINAKRIAGELSIQIATQQAAFDIQALKIQQEKNKLTLEETQLKLKLFDIDLSFKEQEAKTPEQKKAIQAARASIASLGANVGQQLQDLPAQNQAQLALQQQQGRLAVGTAAFQNQIQNGDESKRGEAQRSFAANFLPGQNIFGALDPNFKPTSINQSLAGLDQQQAINSTAFQDAKNQSGLFAAEAAARAAQQRDLSPVLNKDGSVTQRDNANFTPTINITVNGNGDAKAIGEVVNNKLLEVTRQFKQ